MLQPVRGRVLVSVSAHHRLSHSTTASLPGVALPCRPQHSVTKALSGASRKAEPDQQQYEAQQQRCQATGDEPRRQDASPECSYVLSSQHPERRGWGWSGLSRTRARPEPADDEARRWYCRSGGQRLRRGPEEPLAGRARWQHRRALSVDR